MIPLRRLPIVGVAVVILGGAALGGCASAPPAGTGTAGGVSAGGPPAAAIDLPAVGLGTADAAFLREVLAPAAATVDSSPSSRPAPVTGGALAFNSAVVFLSLDGWPAGVRTVAAATGMAPADAGRLRRLVAVRRGAGTAAIMEVAARRLPASLALHWAGWTRRDWGLWQDPESGMTLDISSPGIWTATRGAGAVTDIAGWWRSPEGRNAAHRSDLMAATAQQETDGTGGERRVRAIAWVSGLRMPGTPAGLVPEEAVVLVTADGPAAVDGAAAALPADGSGVRFHLLLPFSDEQTARVAMVAARLLFPRVLADLGLELDAQSAIVRHGTDVLILSVPVDPAVLETILSGMAPGVWNGGTR